MVALQIPECVCERLIALAAPPTIEVHDRDLARVIAAWQNLPDAVKAAVLAIIGGYEPPKH